MYLRSGLGAGTGLGPARHTLVGACLGITGMLTGGGTGAWDRDLFLGSGIAGDTLGRHMVQYSVEADPCFPALVGVCLGMSGRGMAGFLSIHAVYRNAPSGAAINYVHQ